MEDFFQVFKYSSFSRGYHVYKNVCILIIGDDSLTCEQEEHNENDKNAVAIVPAGNYMFKVNNRNARTRCEICSKLTIKTPERRHWRRSDVFIVNFEHISHLVLVFLLLTLNR